MTDVMSSLPAPLPSDAAINERRTHRRTGSQQRSKSNDRFALPDVEVLQTSKEQLDDHLTVPTNSQSQGVETDREDEADPADTSDENSPTNTSPNQSNNQPTKRDPAAQQKALMRQIEYYFSNQNLWKDAFLLGEMSKHEHQFIDLSVIAGLKKVAKLSTDMDAIIAAIKASNKLELSEDAMMVKRVQALPPYDQLKDAHRSLYVSNLPAGSTLKSVKKLFSIFGKVTYVLRADQIDSAAVLNSSPKLTASTPPMSPQLVPRLSLGASHQPISLSSTPTSILGSMSIPTMSASDAIETPFSAAYVQFEKPASMQRAVDMITSIPKPNVSSTPKTSERIISITSPYLGRRTLGAGASPIPSSRALSSQTTSSTHNTASPPTDVSHLLQKRGLGHSNSSSPSLRTRRIGVQTNSIDMSNGDMSPHCPSPSSPMVQVLDASATPSQLPPIFATFSVMTKVDRLRDHALDDEKQSKQNEKEAEKQVKSNKLSSNWRNVNYVATESPNKPPVSDDEMEVPLSKQSNNKSKTNKNRNPILTDNNIIHISPKPSPHMSPSPATPIMSYASLGQSPGNSPALMAALGQTALLPALDLNKPRFSLTKRTAGAASHVSRFALGPDGPESKGFAGRGRGKPVAV